ncbi:GntR family transcriptional regulator [Janthinobacterium sp. 17J80-10]|uniref:GntR family transcriptional regulator n=1 Tax=Janthinobacterium sp. 17J80-10 TaxID=2497863 RepID=UPI0010058CDF|nr:GntR family transcriptional regulator [Janthinobacterium sp. 17J80-10]QAU35715.1 GntR family transcriptional regulator [Janthinobacterium sp. 17J80-10]
MMKNTVHGDKEQNFSEALMADLLAGKYSPGEWLKQAELEGNYGANRFEVRIALAELNIRGLIEHLPNRGYRVCNYTDQDREQLYEVRTLIETAACRLIVQRATDDQIAEFERLVRAFQFAAENEGQLKMREINFELHACLYSMAGNPMLAAQIKNLRERGIPGRKGVWDTVKSVQVSNADHVEMLDMLRRRDAEGLAAVVYNHLNRWRKYAKPISPAESI